MQPHFETTLIDNMRVLVPSDWIAVFVANPVVDRCVDPSSNDGNYPLLPTFVQTTFELGQNSSFVRKAADVSTICQAQARYPLGKDDSEKNNDEFEQVSSVPLP